MVNGEWHCISQISLSTAKGYFKIDPFRGKREPEDESDAHTAQRETVEESEGLIHLPIDCLPRMDGVGLFHVRLKFADVNALRRISNDFDHNLAMNYDSNFQDTQKAQETLGISVDPLLSGDGKTVQDGHVQIASQVKTHMRACSSKGFFDDIPAVTMTRQVAENGQISFVGKKISTQAVATTTFNHQLPGAPDAKRGDSTARGLSGGGATLFNSRIGMIMRDAALKARLQALCVAANLHLYPEDRKKMSQELGVIAPDALTHLDAIRSRSLADCVGDMKRILLSAGINIEVKGNGNKEENKSAVEQKAGVTGKKPNLGTGAEKKEDNKSTVEQNAGTIGVNQKCGVCSREEEAGSRSIVEKKTGRHAGEKNKSGAGGGDGIDEIVAATANLGLA